MKKTITTITIIVSSFLGGYAKEAPKSKATTMSITEAKKIVSQFFASSIVSQAKKDPNVDIDIFAKQFNAAIAGKDIKIDQAKVSEASKILQLAYLKKQQAAEQKFLNDNKKKKGVIVTKSGLQYIILKKGDGKKINPTDELKVHYEGAFIDGKIFDSSYQRKTPIDIVIEKAKVIKGWLEILPHMSEGAKYKVFIPSKLGYGNQGNRAIPPFSTLVFTIEIVSKKS